MSELHPIRRYPVPFVLAIVVLQFGSAVPAAAQALAWGQRIGSTGEERGLALAADSAGATYVTGLFEGTVTFGPGVSLTSSGQSDLFVAKYDTAGTLIWARRAGSPDDSDSGAGIALDSTGHVYVTGYSGFGTATFDSTSGPGLSLDSFGVGFVAKYDNNGAVLWVKALATDTIGGVAVDAAGNSYVAGTGPGGVYLAKLDAAGALQWESDGGGYAPPNYTLGNAVAIDSAGNSYVTGLFFGTATFSGLPVLVSAGESDLFIAKYGPGGGLLWARRAGDAAFNRGESIAADPAGNVYVAGKFGINSGVTAFLGKYDSDGNPLWSRGASDASAIGEAVAADASGSIYAMGFFQGAPTFAPGVSFPAPAFAAAFVARYDSSGNLAWVNTAGLPTGYVSAGAIDVDATENAYIAGSFLGTITLAAGNTLTSAGNLDVFRVKYGGSNKLSQTITFGPLADAAGGDPPVTLTATASSGLPVSYAVTGPCQVFDNKVTILNIGVCTITASAAGDASYFAALDVTQSLTIGKATPTISLSVSLNPSSAGQSVRFTSVLSSNVGFPAGPVTFMDGATPMGPPVSIDAFGKATFDTSSLSIGDHSITAVSAADTFFLSVTSTALTQNVRAAGSPPGIAKGFAPSTISIGGTTALTFTLTNPNGATALTGVAFTDVFPPGLLVAATPNVSNTCGGTVTAVAGSGSVSLASGALAAGATCQIRVDATATSAGTKTNVTGNVSAANVGAGNSATAVLTVTAAGLTPSIATTVHDAQHNAVTMVIVGNQVHTLVDIRGSAGDPVATGTVTLRWFGNGTCKGSAAASAAGSLAGGSVDLASFAQTPAKVGAYAFQASYGGDAAYAASSGACTLLAATGQPAASIVTVVHNASHAAVTTVPVGTALHDQVTVSASAAPTPGGSVTIEWFTNNRCKGKVSATSGPFTLVNGSVDAVSFVQTPASPGQYAFQARYSGSGTYAAAVGACEVVIVQ